MVDEAPSNSNSQRRPSAAKKEIEQVTTGKVIKRKKPLGTRVKHFFFSRDARGAAGDVTQGVLVPATKDMLVDAGTRLLEQIILGESRRGRGPFRSTGYSPFAYHNQYATTRPATPAWTSGRNDPRPEVGPRSRPSSDLMEIVTETRGEAEEVIDQLLEIIQTYGVASVSDFYALVGQRDEYTDQKYGWQNLAGARASHLRGGGYLIDLPRPIPID